MSSLSLPSSSSSMGDVTDLEELPQPQQQTGEEVVEEDLDTKLRRLERALELNQKLIDDVKTKQFELLARRDELDLNIPDFDDYEDEDEDSQFSTVKNISAPSSSNKRPKPVSLIPFFKPYFRDTQGMSGPLCYDAINCDIRPAVIQMLQSPRYVRPWSDEEKEQIVLDVRSQYLPRYHKDLIDQLESLLDTEHEKSPELIAQINQLNSELALASSKNLEPERWCPLVDWLVVAKLLPQDRSGDDCELIYNNLLHQSIPKNDWTVEEDEQLRELVEKHGNSWDTIAEKMGNGRLAWQCCSRYQSELNSAMRRSGKIEGAEAEEILRIIEKYKFGSVINWNNVCCLIEGRTFAQIQHFYSKHEHPTVVRKWSKLEDKMILAGVALYQNRWKQIAQFFPFRNNRQVRERYTNQLSFKQDRKFGNWTEPEDELILEMSTKYVSSTGTTGINFPEIQRLYFPNRNIYQLYNRYMYLKKRLPEAVFLPQTDNNHDEVDSSVFKKAHITRKRSFHSLAAKRKYKIPEDPEKCRQILVEGRKQLKTAMTRIKTKNNDSEEDLAPKFRKARARKQTKKQPKKKPLQPPVPVILNDPEARQLNDEFDQLLHGYVNLQDHRYAPKSYFLTALDLNTNILLQTVLLEAIDPSLEHNLEIPDNVQLHWEPDQYKYKPVLGELFAELMSSTATVCSLDVIRFYLSNSCLTVEPEDVEAPGPSYYGSAPKTLITPNYSTTFGYSLLELMSKALMFRLVSQESPLVEEFNEDQITEEEEYQDLRSIFYSLFAWPALLASPKVAEDERVQTELLKYSQSSASSTIDSASQSEVEEAVPIGPPKKGRPRKRQFYFHKDSEAFLRTRSVQANIFLTNIRLDTMELLRNIYPIEQTENWLEEPPELLRDRVDLYLSTIWSQVNALFDENREKTKKIKMEADKNTVPKVVRGKAAVPESLEPSRRSSRANVGTVSYSKMLGVRKNRKSPNKLPENSQSNQQDST